jgi:phage shock protein PspC (stress-responsive transcriptional regulator)
MKSLDHLRKSSKDSVLFGVCGGIGEYTTMPGWIWRILFIFSAILGGFGILLYILLVIFMPID